jgi:hypothetical protein
MTITSDMTSEGVARMAAHTHGTPLEEIVNDVFAGMRALEPVGIDPADIIFAPKRFADWQNSSVSDSGCSIGEMHPGGDGIPPPPSGNEYVFRARLSGSGSDYARMQFQHVDAGVPTWGEGTDVWYSASFYLPPGFYASKNSSKDIMRWDAYVNGDNDIQGGLGMGSDDGLYIMTNWPYTRPVETGYIIPEGVWTSIEVHQRISEFASVAQNEIYADGVLVGMSSVPNFKGSAYPANERAINRLRVGLVSEGSVSDANTLYFDKFVISKVATTLP